jgi:hypothetical protein
VPSIVQTTGNLAPPQALASCFAQIVAVRAQVVLRNGCFLCRGRGCHSIYDASEVIDPENDDYRLWVTTT